MNSNSNSNGSLNSPLYKHAFDYGKQLQTRISRFYQLVQNNRPAAKRVGTQLLIDLNAYIRISKDVGVWNRNLQREVNMIHRQISRLTNRIL